MDTIELPWGASVLKALKCFSHPFKHLPPACLGSLHSADLPGKKRRLKVTPDLFIPDKNVRHILMCCQHRLQEYNPNRRLCSGAAILMQGSCSHYCTSPASWNSQSLRLWAEMHSQDFKRSPFWGSNPGRSRGQHSHLAFNHPSFTWATRKTAKSHLGRLKDWCGEREETDKWESRNNTEPKQESYATNCSWIHRATEEEGGWGILMGFRSWLEMFSNNKCRK